MKIAVVGATGLVGGVMRRVLIENRFPVSNFLPVASAKSVGKLVDFGGKDHPVVDLQSAVEAKPQVAIFSAGGAISKQWAPRFEEMGTVVIDNSSAWRMHPDKKLVVPEVNGHVLTENDKIIANPNCSTIQLVMALGPLHQHFKIKRLVISTYQSYTGTGVPAVKQYEGERDRQPDVERVYPHPIFENCLPHCDIFLENDYTKEEMKLVNETRKILQSPEIKITATAVRVPVDGGHSESVNIEFERPYDIGEVREILNESAGIVVQDDLDNFNYPTPLQAKNKNEVFVGRIRRDESIDNGLNLWIVADNLRKGAATNAVQIAEFILEKSWI